MTQNTEPNTHIRERITSFIPVTFLTLLIGIVTFASCDKLVTESTTNNVFDSTTGKACFSCHTDQNDSILVIPKGQWATSAHASTQWIEASVDINGGMYSTRTCGPECHSGNGYVKSVSGGSVSNQSSTIGCFSCHLPHTGTYGAWRMDTLRGDTSIVPLKAVSGQTSSYSMGESNMCARCHQATSVPVILATDTVVTIDKLFGPHSAPQANMLAGSGGFLFTPAAVNSSHFSVANTIQDGCLSCHFRPGSGYDVGEHTFRMTNGSTRNIATCNVAGCHLNAPITDFTSHPRMDSVISLLDSLKSRLADRDVIDPNDPRGLTLTTDTTYPRDLAKIVHNYLLVRHDKSNGAHNALYALRLLKESLAQLDSVPLARFGANPNDICFGEVVQFADSSTGSVQRWFWNFGDGKTSTVQNPSNQYTRPGSYAVTLTVTGSAGSHSTRVANIVIADTTIAKIGLASLSATVGVPFQLTDSSSGRDIVLWSWEFGDPAVTDDTSSAQNPSYSYQNAGTFTASLTVTGDCGIGTTTRQIVVSPPSPAYQPKVSQHGKR